LARTVFEKADAIPLLAEAFREFGYEGASMSRITARTGLGKGSLYHFFPGGKEEMAAEVLAHVDAWFEANVFSPLGGAEPRAAIGRMWTAVDGYFRSGQRVCLVGAFALDETRDRFAAPIRDYFARWVAALKQALVRTGVPAPAAGRLAEDAILGIQGALVLARALQDDALFPRALDRMAAALDAAVPDGRLSNTQGDKDTPDDAR
jgi:TetR/AcrR family transcriptional repressor of lmrAB and yxaGH operons